MKGSDAAYWGTHHPTLKACPDMPKLLLCSKAYASLLRLEWLYTYSTHVNAPSQLRKMLIETKRKYRCIYTYCIARHYRAGMIMCNVLGS